MVALRWKRIFLRIHRRGILRAVRFWQTRWGERSLIVVLAICIGGVAAVAAALLRKILGDTQFILAFHAQGQANALH